MFAKYVLRGIALGSVLIWIACSPPALNVDVVQHREEADRSLANLGRYSRAVALETPAEAMIGSISEVKLDPRNGDLLVGDYRVQKHVFRFDAQGRYVTTYGKHGDGPGELRSLTTFVPIDDGRVVLFSSERALVFESEGYFVHARSLPFIAHAAVFHEGNIYVQVLDGSKPQKHTIHVLNTQLELLTSFHGHDKRLYKLPFIPRHSFTKTNEGLFLAGSFEFELHAYDFSGQRKGRFGFPNREPISASLWQQSRLNRQQKAKILDGLHRSFYTFGFGDRIFIWEVQKASQFYRTSILHPDRGELEVFPHLNLVTAEPVDEPTLNGLVGSFERGVIGFIENPAFLAKMKAHVPAFAELQLDASDNPILVFFEFHERFRSLAVNAQGETDGTL